MPTVTAADVAPEITVVKTADPTTVNEGGESVTYTYAVTNTSASSTDRELTLTALVDDRGTAATGDDVDLLTAGTFVGGDTDSNTLIDAGETWTYTLHHRRDAQRRRQPDQRGDGDRRRRRGHQRYATPTMPR